MSLGASRPSITGTWISIGTRSKSGSCKALSASAPLAEPSAVTTDILTNAQQHHSTDIVVLPTSTLFGEATSFTQLAGIFGTGGRSPEI